MDNTAPGGPIRRTRTRKGDRLSRIVFTLNNYTEEECNLIQTIPCQWLIYGKEVGEQGTPHLQGYFSNFFFIFFVHISHLKIGRYALVNNSCLAP